MLARPRNEGEALRAVVAVVAQRVPPGWDLETTYDERLGSSRADAVLRLTSPDGARAAVVVEVKAGLEAREVLRVRAQLSVIMRELPGSTGMVVARYLAKPLQSRLASMGLSYADATGNVLLSVSRPGLYIADRGADRDPWRGPGRPRGTLKGEPAARVVRALLDEPKSWKITDLVAASGTSTGSVYRVVDFLEAEALAVRDDEGRVVVPDWRALLRRWSEDYQFVATNTITQWIAPRGLDHLQTRMIKGAEGEYAVTGTIAAAEFASYAPARSAMIYVADAQRAAADWDLRRSDTGVNVMLAEPAYRIVLDRPWTTRTGLKIVPPAQVAVDLLTGPGRAPSEAEELLTWMKANEESWRR